MQGGPGFGRTPRFSVSFRPILGRTEAQAWERARTILAQVQAVSRPTLRPQAVGSQRLLDFAAQGSSTTNACGCRLPRQLVPLAIPQPW